MLEYYNFVVFRLIKYLNCKFQVTRVQAYLLDRRQRRFIMKDERERFIKLLNDLSGQPIGVGLQGVYKINFSFLFQVSY